MKKLNLIGKRFGRLFIIKCLGSRKQGKRWFNFWLCQCDCGKFTEVRTGHLISDQIQGCGCKRKLPKGQSAFNSLYSIYHRNAKKQNRSFELSKKQFRQLTQESCSYCGSEPSGIIDVKKQNGIYVYNGIDRIDNSIGYIKENCVPCCKICNYMKRDLTVKEFLDHIKKITVSSVA